MLGLRRRVPHGHENRDLVRDDVFKQLVVSGSNLRNVFCFQLKAILKLKFV